jgi:hypothetical protein
MPPPDIRADNQLFWPHFRGGWVEFHEPRLSAYPPARPNPIPTVQHLALKRQNRLALVVLPNIVGQRLKLIFGNRWKQCGKRVRFQLV